MEVGKCAPVGNRQSMLSVSGDIDVPTHHPCLLSACLSRGLSQAYGLNTDTRGGVSGGTLASGFNQVESENAAEVAQLNHDKYFLLPTDAR